MERFTLLKSIHIFKKHRVQYEMRTHYRCLMVMSLNMATHICLFELVTDRHKYLGSLQVIRFYSTWDFVLISQPILSPKNKCVIQISKCFVMIQNVCLLAVSYNGLHSTSIPWVHPEEPPWRCRHGGDKGNLLQSPSHTSNNPTCSILHPKDLNYFVPICSCYQTAMEKVPDHILEPMWKWIQWWAVDDVFPQTSVNYQHYHCWKYSTSYINTVVFFVDVDFF